MTWALTSTGSARGRTASASATRKRWRRPSAAGGVLDAPPPGDVLHDGDVGGGGGARRQATGPTVRSIQTTEPSLRR